MSLLESYMTNGQGEQTCSAVTMSIPKMHLQKVSHVKCTLNKELFYWILLSIASVAVIFQAVAFFSPAWFSLHAEVKGQRKEHHDKTSNTNVKDQGHVSSQGHVLIDISLGLWTIRGCVNDSCHTVNLNQLRGFMETDPRHNEKLQSHILDEFVVIQCLALTGAITTVTGFISLLVTSRGDKGSHTKCKGFLTTFLWALTGILLLISVAHRKHENSSIEKEMTVAKLNIRLQYPWALPLYGVSGFLSITIALVLLCKILVIDISGGTPGSWLQIGDA